MRMLNRVCRGFSSAQKQPKQNASSQNREENGRFYTKDVLSVWTNLGKYFVVRLGYASLV